MTQANAPHPSTLRDWLPAMAGMVCLGLGAGLIGIFGFFVEPLSREYGASVATINIAPVFLLLVPGIVGPLVGRLVDRVPIRLIMLIGTTLAMLALFAITRVSSLGMSALCFALFALGLAMYGPVVVNGMLVKRYPGREARALAIAAIGISVASVILPPVVGQLLEVLDWRSALAGLAAVLLLILWTAVLTAIPAAGGSAATAGVHTIDRRTIYRDANFWLVGLCIALGLNVAVILAICYPPHFINQGYSAVQAGLFVSVAGGAGLLGKALLALVADSLRARAKWIAAALLLQQAVGLMILLQTPATPLVYLAMLLLGSAGGAFLPMHPYLNSCYFRAEVIGEVNGAQMPLLLPLGLAGPPLAGLAYDMDGDYLRVLSALVLLLIVAAVFALRLPAAKPSR